MIEAKLFRSSGLAALAAGLVIVAFPGSSMAQGRGRGADAWGSRGNDSSARDDQRRSDVFSPRGDRGSGRGSGRGNEGPDNDPAGNDQARGDWSRGRDTVPGTSADRTVTLPAPAQAPVEVRQAPPPRAYSQGDAGDAGQSGSSGWRSNRDTARTPAPTWSAPQVNSPAPPANSQYPGRSDRGGWSQGRNSAPGSYSQRSVTNPNPPPPEVHQAPPPRAHAQNNHPQDYRRWTPDWRENHNYNWNAYRTRNRSIYRLDRYYAPYRNYEYRRLGIGFFLDSLFYSDIYWIDDPWRYRLPDVYEHYRWVRYYDDVLLVDLYTGEVVDVIYDFFW